MRCKGQVSLCGVIASPWHIVLAGIPMLCVPPPFLSSPTYLRGCPVGELSALCVKAACTFALGDQWKPCSLENVGIFLAHRSLLFG